MKTTTVFSAITSLLAYTATATPAEPRAIVTYALETKSTDARFNNLCVETYHTGAGTSDAVLGACSTSSDQFYTNGTQIETTDFGQSAAFIVQAYPSPEYDEWYPVTINVGGNTPGGFTYSSSKGFLSNGKYGFLACYWAHSGNPQLFVLAQSAADTTIIETCALVNLVKAHAN